MLIRKGAMQINLWNRNSLEVRQITNTKKIRILKKIWNYVWTNCTSVTPAMDKKNLLTNYCETIPEPIEVELINDHQQKNSNDSPNSEVEKTFNTTNPLMRITSKRSSLKSCLGTFDIQIIVICNEYQKLSWKYELQGDLEIPEQQFKLKSSENPESDKIDYFEHRSNLTQFWCTYVFKKKKKI